MQVSDSAPNNVAVPGRPGDAERAMPPGIGLDSNKRVIKLTQPEHGMNKALPHEAVPR